MSLLQAFLLTALFQEVTQLYLINAGLEAAEFLVRDLRECSFPLQFIDKAITQNSC